MKRLAGVVTGVAAVVVLAANLWAAKVPDKLSLEVPKGMKPAATWIKKVEFDHTMHRELDKCVRCHHMDDEKTPQEQMQGCRQCHADNTTKGPDSFYAAWHSPKAASCVACHREMGATISCTNGCHKRPSAPAKK